MREMILSSYETLCGLKCNFDFIDDKKKKKTHLFRGARERVKQ